MSLRTTVYAAGFVVLAAVWLRAGELFGVGLAFVLVVGGSALLMLAGVGHEALRRALVATSVRLQEGLRDPKDTLTHILVLAEHSRRNGLVGLAEVETNWAPLQRVCTLVACAADEQRIRLEAASSIELARQRANQTIVLWLFLAVALVGIGVFGSAISLFSATLDGDSFSSTHGLAPFLVAMLSVLVLVFPVLARLTLAREREVNCIQLAYEGGLKILSNNNIDSVFHGLVDLVPGAPSAVNADDIGELEIGRGPWL